MLNQENSKPRAASRGGHVNGSQSGMQGDGVAHQVQDIGRNLNREIFPPLASSLAPENCLPVPGRQVGTMPCPTVADAQILWLHFGSNPLVADGVGVPADHNSCELYFQGRDSG